MAPLQRLKPQLKCDPSGTTEVVPFPTSPADRVFQRTLSRAISNNIATAPLPKSYESGAESPLARRYSRLPLLLSLLPIACEKWLRSREAI
jgi:hypothetical protein